MRNKNFVYTEDTRALNLAARNKENLGGFIDTYDLSQEALNENQKPQIVIAQLLDNILRQNNSLDLVTALDKNSEQRKAIVAVLNQISNKKLLLNATHLNMDCLALLRVELGCIASPVDKVEKTAEKSKGFSFSDLFSSVTGTPGATVSGIFGSTSKAAEQEKEKLSRSSSSSSEEEKDTKTSASSLATGSTVVTHTDPARVPTAPGDYTLEAKSNYLVVTFNSKLLLMGFALPLFGNDLEIITLTLAKSNNGMVTENIGRIKPSNLNYDAQHFNSKFAAEDYIPVANQMDFTLNIPLNQDNEVVFLSAARKNAFYQKITGSAVNNPSSHTLPLVALNAHLTAPVTVPIPSDVPAEPMMNRPPSRPAFVDPNAETAVATKAAATATIPLTPPPTYPPPALVMPLSPKSLLLAPVMTSPPTYLPPAPVLAPPPRPLPPIPVSSSKKSAAITSSTTPTVTPPASVTTAAQPQPISNVVLEPVARDQQNGQPNEITSKQSVKALAGLFTAKLDMQIPQSGHGEAQASSFKSRAPLPAVKSAASATNATTIAASTTVKTTMGNQ